MAQHKCHFLYSVINDFNFALNNNNLNTYDMHLIFSAGENTALPTFYLLLGYSV